MFLEWFRADVLTAETGRRFGIQQANHSVSAKGVLRGIHYADVPPGQAKLVYCPSGAVLDVVVDLRCGSPTFGRSDSIVLRAEEHKVIFVSEGLGHGFCALDDDSSVVYLVSAVYNPQTERTVNPLDPQLALPWPTGLGNLVLSAKDRDAPTLAEAQSVGMLPDYGECAAFYRRLGSST